MESALILNSLKKFYRTAILKNRLRTKQYSLVDQIISGRPYSSIEEFDNKWKSLPKTKKSGSKFRTMFNLENTSRNHFDIDHALDKGSCPLVALSVMNFVPSCQVCNEKLKRSLVLGDYLSNKPDSHLSPSSPDYDFDNKVSIVLEPINATNENPAPLDPAYALDNSDKYKLKFDCADSSYESLIEIFRLRERYDFHKREGLYWLQMKAKYNENNLQMIADILSDAGFTPDRIREDIFRENYDKTRQPCFTKFKKDILKF